MEPKLVSAGQIAGVSLSPLAEIRDERGSVLHMLRSDSPLFHAFGEVYFSEVSAHVVKAWKRHRAATQALAVPVGRVKFVLFDDRPDSTSHGNLAECVFGRPDAYQLLVLPPFVWYGFQGIALDPSIVANCTDMPYDPEESESVGVCPGLENYAW